MAVSVDTEMELLLDFLWLAIECQRNKKTSQVNSHFGLEKLKVTAPTFQAEVMLSPK